MAGLLTWGAVGPSRPISETTPFTYRDGDTFLQQLHGIKNQINYLIENVAQLSQNDSDNLAAVNASMADLAAQFTTSLNQLASDWQALIESSHDEGIVFDPTNGTHIEGFSTVLGRVYDNLRIYAYFAKQYDNLGLTAKQYDDLQYEARHYDLAVTFPALNDVWNG